MMGHICIVSGVVSIVLESSTTVRNSMNYENGAYTSSLAPMQMDGTDLIAVY